MALIEVENLEKIYSDGETKIPALGGVSFSIAKGEFVAIMGPSGSGKSTLLHILGFLDRHTKGQYRFNHKTIDDYSNEEIARVRNKKMGFVFQFFNLLPRTSVLDNIKLPLSYSNVKESEWNERAMKVIKQVDLAHRIKHDPSQLSGGEKQRAAIARALINDPDVVFADEPTGNLDTKSGEMIMNILKKINQDEGRTIILITHETYIANFARRILYFRDGKIEQDKLIR